MKKTTLVVLMAIIITPCFAQEVEPDGMFSLHGTRWATVPTGINDFGFYGGMVYPRPRKGLGYYIDFGVVSFFFRIERYGSNSIEFGIMQPIGIGIAMGLYESPLFPFLSIVVLTKVEDDWVP